MLASPATARSSPRFVPTPLGSLRVWTTRLCPLGMNYHSEHCLALRVDSGGPGCDDSLLLSAGGIPACHHGIIEEGRNQLIR